METTNLPETIQWRVNLSSPPDTVFNALATDAGRRKFWAQETRESENSIRFSFLNGMVFEGNVLKKRCPTSYEIEYFGGSRVHFDLKPDGKGGTDLTVTEMGVPERNRLIHYAGWVSVLLALKAAVDFSIDLRNNDPLRTWDHGFVDV